MTSAERQRQLHFKACGYLKLPNLLSPDEIAMGKEMVWQAIKTKTGRDLRNSPINEIKERVNKRSLYHLVDEIDPRFMAFAGHPALISSLMNILGPDIEFITNRHNHARLNLPGDQKVELHRDILQPTRGVVTALIYLDQSTLENGCTHILPCSHNYLPDVPHTDHGGGGTWIEDYPEEFMGVNDQAIPVPMAAGGALIFNSLVFHTIGDNYTQNTRMSLAFTYRSADELSTVDEPKAILVSGTHRRVGN